jgi:hypothetical protein
MRRRALLVAFLLVGAVVLVASLRLVPLSHELETPSASSEHSNPKADAVGVTNAIAVEPSDPVSDGLDALPPVSHKTVLPSECQSADNDAAKECLGRWIWMRFESEGRDDKWADATERTIIDGLAQIPSVTTVTALNVDCRETVCRLQMAFPTVDSVPTRDSQARDVALVSNVFVPFLDQAQLRRLIVPYPTGVDLPERTYYFVRP